MALLWITLWRYEMTSKHARAQLRALRRLLGGRRGRGAAPRRSAVPLTAPTARDDGGVRLMAADCRCIPPAPYVAAAYIVFFALIGCSTSRSWPGGSAGSSASSAS